MITAARRLGTAAIFTAIFAVILARTPAAIGQERSIDIKSSVMTVRVYKGGVLSALGHDHEIAAPIAGGSVDITAHRVELHVSAAALRVEDPKVSDKDRDEIRKTMLGPEVLDAEHHAEIAFKSTGAESGGEGSWSVRGDLTLHGQTRPVTLEVREKGGHYTGTARLKQSEFGIKPVKVGGGAVRVKDEVSVGFDIQLAR